MLPSLGYFRGIDCPFYANGLCQRPYCHFRHVKKALEVKSTSNLLLEVFGEESTTPGVGGSVSTLNTTPTKEFTYVPTPISECNKDVSEEYDPANAGASKKTHKYDVCTGPSNEAYSPTVHASGNGAVAKENSTLFPEYKPTPLGETKDKRKNKYTLGRVSPVNDDEYDPSELGKARDNNVNNSTSDIADVMGKNSMFPEYTPTPLGENSEKHVSRYSVDRTSPAKDSEYDPSQLNKVKEKKSSKYSISKTGPVNDLEYDPMSNYSTFIKPKKSKEKTYSRKASYADARFSSDEEDESKDVEEDLYGEEEETIIKTPQVTEKKSSSKTSKSGSGEHSKKERIDRQKDKVKDKLTNKDKSTKSSGKAKSEKVGKKSNETEKKKSHSESKDKVKVSDSKANGNKSKHKKESESHLKVEHRKDKSRKDGRKESEDKHSKTVSKDKERKQTHISTEKQNKTNKDKIKISQTSDKRRLETLSGDQSAFCSKKQKLDKSKSSPSSTIPSRDDAKKAVTISKPRVTPLSKKSKSAGKIKVQPMIKSSGSGKHVNSKVVSKKKSVYDLSSSEDSSPKKRGEKRKMSTDSDQSRKVKLQKKTEKPIPVPMFSSESDVDNSMRLKKGSQIISKRKQDLFGDDSDSDEVAMVMDDDVITISSDSDNDDFHGVINDSDLEDLSEHDTYEECLQIFNDQSQSVKASTKVKRQSSKSSEHDDEEGRPVDGDDTIHAMNIKQRVAHQAKFDTSNRMKKVKVKPYFQPSPAQVCHNRYLAIQQKQKQLQQQQQQLQQQQQQLQQQQQQQQHQRQQQQQTAAVKARSNSTNSLRDVITDNSSSKKRVAHTPKPSTSSKVVGAGTEGKTLCKSQPKKEKRVAHVPQAIKSNKPRPTIPPEYGSKVPANIRQRYLNIFIDECLKFCVTEDDAYSKALSEEMVVYQRSSSRNIYLNLSINTVKRLRSLQPQNDSDRKSPSKANQRKSISHEAVLGGRKATQTSFTLHRSGYHVNDNNKLEGAALYEKLKTYILSEVQLQENGFPRPSPDKAGMAVVMKEQNKKNITNDADQRICTRCGKVYIVRPGGRYVTREECVYHWGKLWKKKVGGVMESRFSCCQGDVQSKGCCVCKLHVSDNKTGNLEGYMTTMAKSPPDDGNPGVYALDCEMCYTTIGLELTRVTIVNADNEVIYDVLVKPDHPIIDYNTRFSGITEDDLEPVTTVLCDVQAVLLNQFSADTILIGHSLESDLLALKMIHSTVVDTSVVFPHRLGPPYKKALRTLMGDYLSRIIQNDVGGHDSKEDAVSCMDLMRWKVKEDGKTKKYF